MSAAASSRGEGEVIAIVVGASLAAERDHRPIAYRLRDLVAERAPACGASPVVCTDLWFLNAGDMRRRPAVCVGGPEVNAATAYFADKLPSAFAIDGLLVVQLDPEFVEPTACCWGVDAGATSMAVDAFAERYLDLYLRATRRPEP